MNSRAAEWRPGPSVCRCCLTEGCYKDISTEYFWMGRREVYAEMLAETFDLAIAYSKSTGPNSNSRLICEACIARLRDASNFKRQVRDCERTFLQHLDPASSTSVPSLDVIAEPLGKPVKIEESDDVKEEHLASDDDDMVDDVPDFGEDEDEDDLDDQPLTRLASKTPKKEAVDITDLLDNAKAAVKRKSTSKVKASPAKKVKPAKKEKVVAKPPKPPKKKKGEAPHVVARRNAKTLVSYTTAYPFRLPHSSPMCVYCDQVCTDSAEFRKHMEEEHKTFWLPAAFAHLMREDYLKVDITDLKCRICCQSFETLDDIAKHLNDCHIHKIDLDHQLGLYPFNFSGGRFCCVFCDNIFSCIRALSRHMPSHFTKYVCEECGKNFSTGASLYHHTRYIHALGGYVCRKCKRNFESVEERRQHFETSEMCCLYKCSYCPQRFLSYTMKTKHQYEKHCDGKAGQHQCGECGLVFKSRQVYNCHFAVAHAGVSYSCQVCERVFGSKSDLKKHNRIHNKSEDHHCSVCSKIFARKEYLKQHMRVVHSIKKIVKD